MSLRTGLIVAAMLLAGVALTARGDGIVTAGGGVTASGIITACGAGNGQILYDNAGNCAGETTVPAANGGAGTINGALKGNGSGVVSQAACADLSNGAASCSTDTTSASNISAGTLAAARGGAGTINGALKGSGAGVVSQAACADLSNGATGCSTAVGTSGATLPLNNTANNFSANQTFTTIEVGSSSAVTLATGEIGLAKIAASGSAPGAGFLKLGAVCGTNAGSAKIIAYAGTSTTPVTIVDNIGSGVTGC